LPAVDDLFFNRGVDIIGYSRDDTRFVGIQVKALSKRNPVPLGTSLDKIMGDFWGIVNKGTTSPSAYVLLPSEIREGAHRGEKDGRVSFWLQPADYDQDQFREAWECFVRAEKMKTEDLRIEDVLSKANVQGNLRQLQSDNKENVRSSLHTLASIARLADRRDCLLVLAGFYVLEVRSIEDLEMFIKATDLAHSPELAIIVLKDIMHNRELSRRRLFMNDLVALIGRIKIRSTPEQTETIGKLIESSEWGEKQKAKFTNEL
jgi:hypothetical protein